MPTITREYANGSMTIKKDGVVIREGVTSASFDPRIAKFNTKIAALTTRRDRLQGYKDLIDAS